MNVLLSVKEGLSICVISGSEYPIVEVTPEYVAIATTNESSANNIGARIGGDVSETPTKEFPYEIHVPLTKFNKIVEADNWSELIEKHFV